MKSDFDRAYQLSQKMEKIHKRLFPLVREYAKAYYDMETQLNQEINHHVLTISNLMYTSATIDDFEIGTVTKEYVIVCVKEYIGDSEEYWDLKIPKDAEQKEQYVETERLKILSKYEKEILKKKVKEETEEYETYQRLRLKFESKPVEE